MGSVPSAKKISSVKTSDLSELITQIKSKSPDAINHIKQLQNFKKIEVSENQWSLLHLASWYGNYPLCKELIKLGIDTNLLDNHKETPLHLAAWRGHFKTVKILLSTSDIGKVNVKGESAKDLAREKGYKDIVELIENFKENALTIQELI
ncbi:hypothetical protein SteCoe_24887 [Stentor coeruleus]|uniref:Uncharacterized protein n=1 Tax=Stentor coeruleus TaxID=5963 RepID=A0A1R2BGH8_9CILI|nr:hypothetical protein SteCoe_24887 [Stentor coeruleus]